MVTDMNTQTPLLRKNISNYLQYSELDAATIASAKTWCDLNSKILRNIAGALLLMRVGLSVTTFRSSYLTTLYCGFTTVSVMSYKEKWKQGLLQV